MFNILVVEDNLDLRELFVTTINNAGYRAFGAINGQHTHRFNCC